MRASVFGQAGSSDYVGSLAAMVVVALAFQPLRRRLGRLADRVVYGRRADPHEARARFSHSLAGHASSTAVFPRLAEAMAGGNRADGLVASSLGRAEQAERAGALDCLRAGVYAELGVDVPHVRLDRAGRDVELTGDLGRGQVARQVAQHA